MSFAPNAIALAIAASPAVFTALSIPAVRAGEFTTCSFNYQIISCRLDSVKGGIKITWFDGKKMVYSGQMFNNAYLRDTLGGSWQYLDFEMGKAFSLKNSSNRNVIIWNGTYKMYGSYVGL